MTAPLVIFDLDGTLIDTAPDLVDSLNHTIEPEDLPPVTFADLNHLVGQGVRVMIRRAFQLRNTPLNEALEDRLFDRYVAHYEANMPGHSQPYLGVLECLDRLHGAGVTLALCTNKAERLALPLLEKLALASRFKTKTYGDSFEFRKPDGRHILATIAQAVGNPEKALMIGDSVNDIKAAQNAGIKSVAVTFGYSDVPVHSLGATSVIDRYSTLTPDFVLEILGLAEGQ